MTEVPLVQKILSVHDALDLASIRHAFGGALALAFHVENPRATADIDVNISAPTDQARDVLTALPAEVSRTDSDVARIQRDGQVRLWWGRTPLDLFFPQHVLHDVVASRATEMSLGSGRIPVLSATDLTVFKALFNRTKDWADIEAMIAFGSPDLAEVRGWIVELLGADDARLARLDEATTRARAEDPTWRDLVDPERDGPSGGRGRTT